METIAGKPTDADHQQAERYRENPPFRGFFWGLLLAALYLILCLHYEKTTGKKIRFVTPGASPPCMPPQVGEFPDCRDPEKK